MMHISYMYLDWKKSNLESTGMMSFHVVGKGEQKLTTMYQDEIPAEYHLVKRSDMNNLQTFVLDQHVLKKHIS